MPRKMNSVGTLNITAEMMNDEPGTGNVYISGPIVAFAYPDYFNETSAFSVRKALAAIDGAETLNVYIDSPGGYLDEAMTIMREIAEHKATKKNAFIMECASAATLATLPCDHVSIYEGGEVMIHNPSAYVSGTPKAIITYGEGLQKRATSVAEMYAKRMGKSVEEVQAMMDNETWMSPQEAVDNGFAHEIIPIVADSGVTMCAGDARMEVADRLFGYSKRPKRDNACHMAKAPTSAHFTGNNAPPSGAQSNIDEGKDDVQMPTTIEELMNGNMSLYNEITARGAKAERERIKALDEMAAKVAGEESAKMIRDAKYGDNPRTAQEIAVEIVMAGGLMQTPKEPAKNPEQSYMEQRKAETAKMQEIKGGSSKDNDPGADDDDMINAFAKMGNEHIELM